MTCSRCGEVPLLKREEEEGYIRQFPIRAELLPSELIDFSTGFQPAVMPQALPQCPSCPKNYQWAMALGGIFLPMFVAYAITRK